MTSSSVGSSTSSVASAISSGSMSSTMTSAASSNSKSNAVVLSASASASGPVTRSVAENARKVLNSGLAARNVKVLNAQRIVNDLERPAPLVSRKASSVAKPTLSASSSAAVAVGDGRVPLHVPAAKFEHFEDAPIPDDETERVTDEADVDLLDLGEDYSYRSPVASPAAPAASSPAVASASSPAVASASSPAVASASSSAAPSVSSPAASANTGGDGWIDLPDYNNDLFDLIPGTSPKKN